MSNGTLQSLKFHSLLKHHWKINPYTLRFSVWLFKVHFPSLASSYKWAGTGTNNTEQDLVVSAPMQLDFFSFPVILALSKFSRHWACPCNAALKCSIYSSSCFSASWSHTCSGFRTVTTTQCATSVTAPCLVMNAGNAFDSAAMVGALFLLYKIKPKQLQGSDKIIYQTTKIIMITFSCSLSSGEDKVLFIHVKSERICFVSCGLSLLQRNSVKGANTRGSTS